MSKSSILFSLDKAAVVYRGEAGQERRVWSDVSLEVRSGEWLVVTGPNGCGKSTLAGVLLGLCPLSGGKLVRPESAVVRGVLQAPEAQFVGDTIADEFQYMMHDPDMDYEAWIESELRSVGLSVSPRHPLSALSGGQKQLVNIAVALAAKPDVLVLDEPTAMLDPAVRKDVLHAVSRAHERGTTIVWITHRLEEAAQASRVVAFSNGAVVFAGEPRTFFYGADEHGAAGGLGKAAPCGSLGLELPFAVRTATELLRRGVELPILPLDYAGLAEAVAIRCR